MSISANLPIHAKPLHTPVYLLKTPSNPSDGYQEHLSTLASSRYNPIHFIPVLEHKFQDDALRTLRRHIERFALAAGSPADGRRPATHNAAKRYGGMIFTSQRAVEAFASVVARLDPAKLNTYFDPAMPLYVVGKATARGVQALGLPCRIVGGEESGSGGALAQVILEFHQTLNVEETYLNGRKLPLLFLVGEQRRDVIPKTLQSEDLPPDKRIQVMEVVVYETGEMASFEEDFTDVLQQQQAQVAKGTIRDQWVVVFSPQGCEAMLSALGWLDEKTGRFSEALRQLRSEQVRTRVVTIGRTTRDFLVSELGFEPDAVAAMPSPEGVGEAISTSAGQ